MRTESHHSILKKILDNYPVLKLKDQIRQLHPSDVAHLLESLPAEKRIDVWKIVSSETKGEVLVEVRDEVRQQLIEASKDTDLVAAVSHLQIDEISDLDEKLPHAVVNAIIKAMDNQTKKRYELVKDYPDDTAGGLMDVDAVAVRSDMTIFVTLRYMRLLRKKYNTMPEHLDRVFVVDKNNHFLGSVSLKNLVSFPARTKIADIMSTDTQAILDTLPTKKVAKIFEDKDLLSAPVVNSTNILLGRITVDDVIDVIREEGEKLVMRPAGLKETTDVFSPVLESVKYRAIWHGINLINGFVAALTISFFTHSIEKIVALAILMPIVASMGGVVGNQTLTLVTRGIALDQITRENKLNLLAKEIMVGFVNGLFWAVIVALITYFWLHNFLLSLAFGIALLLSLLLSATAGTLIPLMLNKMGIDPALAGSVILVAVSDVGGFFIFLGIATLILLK